MSASFPPIAIVGRACVLPGALSPAELWAALVAGRDLVASAPAGRWRVEPARVRAAGTTDAADRTWSDRGGYVSGFEERFDAQGFGRPSEDVLALDPLFHWALHVGREALRDAGHDGRGSARIGLVLGNLSFPTSALAALAEATWLSGAAAGAPDPRNRFMSGLPAHLVARALGLGAGAFALDAACASSLYALKLACDRLHDGSADAMLAGAVCRADDLFIHVGFCALQALSRSGRSRPFHREADGLVPAEGAVAFVLKRLADARAAGDRILGVIRGIGVSNDGRGSGLLAPSEEGQRRALLAAYDAAGWRPADVGLLECHATGTPIGDAVELRSTGAVFAGCEGVPIGSVKSNLGHLITAAGGAGLLKVLGAFEHAVRPPTLHADLPLAALSGSPFRLLTHAEPWPDAGPRRAGVSAFGFGGNNAHLLVEEWRGERERRAISEPVTGVVVAAEPRAAEPPATAPALAASDARPAATGAPADPALAADAAAEDDVVLVGLGVRVADLESAAAFAEALFEGRTRLRPGPTGEPTGHADAVRLGASGLRFPPRDLGQALPQQLLVLAAALEAVAGVAPLPRERTAVIVGMGCDPEVARYGARWRTPAAAAALRDALAPALEAAGVVGAMPNIVANRINSQLDLAGPSFSVSAEEASGLVALGSAARWLRGHAIDAAVVGAVDLSVEPVHSRAAEACLAPERRPPGDAAVVFVLRRRGDAERGGDAILARLETGAEAADGGAPTLGLAAGATALTPLFGHAHAASGLVHVAAAVQGARHAALPAGAGPARPWLPDARGRRAVVAVSPLEGDSVRVGVSAEAPPLPVAVLARPTLLLFAAPDRASLAAAVAEGRTGGEGPFRLAIVGRDAAQARERLERARSALASAAQAREAPAGDGIAYREAPLGGELGFVFAGPAGAYRDMGRELLLALPALVDRVARGFGRLREAAAWVYESGGEAPTPEQQLWGASFLSQAHAVLTRERLGLRPAAAIGFCSGETNALFALGAWDAIDGLYDAIQRERLYTRELAGGFDVVRRAWGEQGPVEWSSWRLLAPEAELRRALEGEHRAHLAIRNAPGDVVVSGEARACERVVARVGRERARRLGYEVAVHCPEFAGYAETWRRLHHRPTRPVPGVRFYTHATCASYVPDADSAAEALLGQALGPVDFPRLVEQAWRDGVRVFLEHGPQGGCSRWIERILGDRPHLAVALDLVGEPSLLQIARAAAQLHAAGLALDPHGLQELFTTPTPEVRGATAPSPELEWPAHRPLPALATVAAATPSVVASRAAPGGAPEDACETMPVAPPLPPVLDGEPARVTPPAVAPLAASASSSWLAALVAHHGRLADAHRAFLESQALLHRRFLAQRGAPRWPEPRDGAVDAGRPPARVPRSAAAAAPAAPPADAPEPLTLDTPAPAAAPALEAPARRPGPRLDRAQLEALASGPVSAVFGPLFREQDSYARVVRMPEPPLLLADRVLGIAGQPGAMGLGTLWTETDVSADAWYLHEGRMPAGILIESGQADLLLISWLGVDRLNRGERVYRLLGCELSFHGGLPRPGETLAYEIHVDGHATQDAVRLFFFHYDCTAAGRPRLTVRGGQAGFFTDAELAASGGILWDAATAQPAQDARVDSPLVHRVPSALSREALAAFAAGRVDEAFGAGFERAATHVQTPRPPGGRLLLLHEVSRLDPRGGPWGRGYLRAVWRFAPDDWFFAGHFKNDPCMPGTLMFEGCLQAMASYLTALGFTLERDAWRFEPVPDETYRLRCRGQATPASRELVYELFVEELHGGPEPTLYADLLCTVDGLKAFHCRRMGLRLVPDWPLERQALPPAPERPAAEQGGVRFDDAHVRRCIWGRPSETFGPLYAGFDGPRRLARLPAPPYDFLSRITRFEGPLGARRAGLAIEAEWDVPAEAWFFSDNSTRRLPFAALLESQLQPCGWSCLAAGIPLASQEDLFFRNLDGRGTLLREVGPGAGPLRTRARLVDVSGSGGMVLVAFEVEGLCGEAPVYRMSTGFGFFPGAALARQAGLAAEPGDSSPRAQAPPLAALAAAGRPELGRGRLALLDRLTGFWPTGGRRGLGRLQAEKDVSPDDWFFKAHFFQDPVQPGSLGLEALLQLVEAYVLVAGLDRARPGARFQAPAVGEALAWKYRGQVLPHHRRVRLEIEVRERIEEAGALLLRADGWLEVDGTRIYSARNLAVRLIG